MATDRVRIDSWLWAVRLTKTRSAATSACKAGHVRIGEDRAKPAQPVRIGDQVRVRLHGFETVVIIKELLTKRVSAPIAQAAYTDISPPRPERPLQPWIPRRDPGAGRPTKRDRRALDQLRGRRG